MSTHPSGAATLAMFLLPFASSALAHGYDHASSWRQPAQVAAAESAEKTATGTSALRRRHAAAQQEAKTPVFWQRQIVPYIVLCAFYFDEITPVFSMTLCVYYANEMRDRELAWPFWIHHGAAVTMALANAILLIRLDPGSPSSVLHWIIVRIIVRFEWSTLFYNARSLIDLISPSVGTLTVATSKLHLGKDQVLRNRPLSVRLQEVNQIVFALVFFWNRVLNVPWTVYDLWYSPLSIARVYLIVCLPLMMVNLYWAVLLVRKLNKGRV